MTAQNETLTQQVVALLQRWLHQNGLAGLDPNLARDIAERFVRLLDQRPLPRRLRPEEMGEPGEVAAEEIEPMVGAVLTGVSRAEDLAPVIRQLVKTCYYPEFKKCRDSYRERHDNGGCKRQSLDRVRGRISGSHCVDCPYWTALTPQQHEDCLAEGWLGDVATLHAHRAQFLPEDFRAFRVRVRALAPKP